MNIYPNPELGPFFEGDILTNPYGRNGIPNEIYRWEKGIFKFHVQDDYSFKEMETIYIAILEIVSNTCITVNELLTSSIREDRDEYISINIDNVYPSERFQFNIFPSETYGVPMSWRRKVSGVLFFFALSLLEYFATSFPLWTHPEPNPEPDRDDYISINLNNVLPAEKYNFDIYPSNDYGVPFPIFPIYYDRDPEFGPFFQGDIIGDPDDRSGIPSEGYRWPQGHVLFFVQDDYSFQEMETIYKAVMEIIGRKVCLTDGPGKAVHETIHALGFYHEHTREDRDRFVKINIDNVILNKRKNFAILPSNDFDFGSVSSILLFQPLLLELVSSPCRGTSAVIKVE
ncbi:unnamed protein product [Allacma fusca]|uniref:Peptidase M12A domain-containing protein n=1 Tax=Allacma fusca TaxID=39272 RepID=A0A8J2LLU3_9HEXA|nr:unnamed protein product [Allacma fusca]